VAIHNYNTETFINFFLEIAKKRLTLKIYVSNWKKVSHFIKQKLCHLFQAVTPILDEDKIAEMEILIHEAMEFNWTLSYEFFEDGYIKTITGKTIFVDYINKYFRIQDEKEYNYQIPFYKLVNVSKIY